MTTQDELKTSYAESSNRLQEQAIVTDNTNAQKPLVESVKYIFNKGKKLYSQNVNEILDIQLSSNDRGKVVDLAIMPSEIKK